MIIAQMVGRNETSRFLEPVLRRIKDQVDEIVFTDDFSEDDTAEIASKYAHVYKNDSAIFPVHEGKLRSVAWHNLSNHAKEGDWIIAIDCDEMLYALDNDNNTNIKKVLDNSPYDVVNVRFYHMWSPTHYRVDKLWAPNNSSRIFRFKEDGVFLDKKLACGSEPTYVMQDIQRKNYWLHSGLVMQHLGYIHDPDKEAKHKRYMNLDRGEFHDLKHIESIVDPNPTLIKWGNFGI